MAQIFFAILWNWPESKERIILENYLNILSNKMFQIFSQNALKLGQHYFFFMSSLLLQEFLPTKTKLIILHNPWMHGDYAKLSDFVMVGRISGNNYEIDFENCRCQIVFEPWPNLEEFWEKIWIIVIDKIMKLFLKSQRFVF